MERNEENDLDAVVAVSIPAGTFSMGSSYGSGDEKPVHQVTLLAFEMSVTPITQGQYQEVMGNNPSQFAGSDNLPVETVSWNDAVEFCQKLSYKTGSEFRLPTEAEWEYACRAGTTTRFNLGDMDSDLARAGWYGGNSGKRTHPVGQKIPNAWEMYDMHGNVNEWCLDWYGDYTSSSQNNPSGEQSGASRVIRGGGWTNYADSCRSASRYGGNPANRYGNVGFRVVRRAGSRETDPIDMHKKYLHTLDENMSLYREITGRDQDIEHLKAEIAALEAGRLQWCRDTNETDARIRRIAEPFLHPVRIYGDVTSGAPPIEEVVEDLVVLLQVQIDGLARQKAMQNEVIEKLREKIEHLKAALENELGPRMTIDEQLKALIELERIHGYAHGLEVGNSAPPSGRIEQSFGIVRAALA